ncbi:tail fiber assembly protein [Phaeobacter inhibens]|uniref:tail fiber assembly protein n=1 Tax=Phaeobacter inhibens TaxID=221822 RepID=UPI002492FD53|nr:tail fiber assembly protein [Phaeobacter inhibens]
MSENRHKKPRRFAIYRKDTGEIRQITVCPAEAIGGQLEPGEKTLALDLAGEAELTSLRDLSRVRVDQGRLVPFTPPLDLAAEMAAIRRRRDKLLAGTDWTQMPDVPIDLKIWGSRRAYRRAWRKYRKALRDLTDTITDVGNVTWPQPPEKGQ